MLDLFKNKKGFTLIELLVVISIISLLSAVVMSSLNSARKKSQEAAIKSDLQSIKTQAELSYSKTGDYSLVASEIAPFLAHINANGGNANFRSSNDLVPSEGYKRFGVSVKFNSDITKNWSVSDQSGLVVWDTTNQPNIQKTWSEAKLACEELGKRLPTVEELKAVRESHGGTGFMNGAYWSNTTYALNSPEAWIVEIWNGDVGHLGKSNSVWVRCVR